MKIGSSKQTDPALDPTRSRLGELADAARADVVANGWKESSLRSRLLTSREHIDEVRQRIEQGYYHRPDVLRHIADRLAEDIE